MLTVSSCGRIWCLWSSGNVKCQNLCPSGRCKMLGAFWEPTTQQTAVTHVTGNPDIQSALKKQQEWNHFHFHAKRTVAVSDKMTTLNPESHLQPWIPPSELKTNAEDPENRYISLGRSWTLLSQLLVYSHLCSEAWVVPLAFTMLSLAATQGEGIVVSLLPDSSPLPLCLVQGASLTHDLCHIARRHTLPGCAPPPPHGWLVPSHVLTVEQLSPFWYCWCQGSSYRSKRKLNKSVVKNPLSITTRVVMLITGSGNPWNASGCGLEGQAAEEHIGLPSTWRSRVAHQGQAFTMLCLQFLMPSALSSLLCAGTHFSSIVPLIYFWQCCQQVGHFSWVKPKGVVSFLITYLPNSLPKPVQNLSLQSVVQCSAGQWHRGKEGRTVLTAWASIAISSFVLWNQSLLVLPLLCPQKPLQLKPQLMATALR